MDMYPRRRSTFTRLTENNCQLIIRALVPSSRSRPNSLLPLHRDSLQPSNSQSAYPPLAQTWNRLRAWLAREYPELGDTLNYGILPQDLAQIEMQFGFALPSAVRESYLAADGQEAESSAGCSDGLFFGLTLLPLEDVLEEWRFWREVDDDPATGSNSRLRTVMQSIPPGWVRKEYSQKGWIPLIVDKAGNYIGVDLNPGEGGTVGQVIVFGRDFDTKVVMWRGEGKGGWGTWLASFVEELESGEGYEIGAGGEASEESEDDLGYESYFYDGTGRGQGDGGGDTGTGGLRLCGEYKGWSPLEAWADRSVKKWYETGAITEEVEEERDKVPERVGLGVLDLPSKVSDVEVPIPVLADVSDPSAESPRNATNRSPRLTPPTISITKPPAPLPVALPTPDDIAPLPSPPNSRQSYDDDLESGRSDAALEFAQEQEKLTYVTRKSPRPKVMPELSGGTILSPASLPLPSSPVSSTPLLQAEQLPTPPPVDIPDLMSDSEPALKTALIQPSTPTMPAQAFELIRHDDEAINSYDGLAVADEADESVDDIPDPDVTIRLVGGGGTAGPANETFFLDHDEDTEPKPDVADTESVHSVSSVDHSSKIDEKVQKKTKSGLSGLKKLGLGGKRKKDSSTKYAV